MSAGDPLAAMYLQAFTLFVLLAMSCNAATAWTLTPMKLERKLKPGESMTDVLVIDNSGTAETKRFEIKPVDWALDANGDLTYSEPGDLAHSLSAHIICTPMQFKCAPGERKLIRYTLSVPNDIPVGEHCLGLQALEVVMPTKDNSTGRINVGVAVKCGFLCAMSILTDKIAPKALEPETLNYSPINNSIVLEIKNPANVRSRPFWTFKLINDKGIVIEESAVADFLILRESKRTITIPLKTTLAAGQYKLLGKLDQGMSFPVQELEKDFAVSKEGKQTKNTSDTANTSSKELYLPNNGPKEEAKLKEP